jgi:hypothetical protein
LTAPTFTELITAQRHYVDDLYTELNRNWRIKGGGKGINVGGKGINWEVRV